MSSFNLKFLSFVFILGLATQPVHATNLFEACLNLFRRQGDQINENAFSKAFRSSTKKAESLMDRTLAFQQKWPDRVKLIDDVNFKFEDPLASAQKRRKMLAISLANISQEEEQRILKDYVDYLSWNMISFPLGEQAGHLYTRVGSMSLDFLFSGLKQNDYRFASGARLETMVSLSETEFKNLRQYLDNIDSKGSDTVLGDFSYAGANQGVAGQSLSKNKPAQGGHNCTSWISTAPVGESGENLKDLVGIGNLNVYTNPGWWTTWIQTRAPADRVPYVIYMSRDESIDTIENRLKGQTLNWNYGLH